MSRSDPGSREHRAVVDSAHVEVDLIQAEAVGERDEFYFAIQLAGFDIGDDSDAERHCRKLVFLLDRELSDRNEGSRAPYVVINRGFADKKHAYIAISCSERRLRELAEQTKFELKLSESVGGGFQAFTNEAATSGVFEVAGSNLDGRRRENPLKASSSSSSSLFTPSQTQALLRDRIDGIFDEFVNVKNSRGLDVALDAGLISDFFALHTLSQDTAFFLSRRNFLARYANLFSMFSTPLTFARPHREAISYLRDYFGEQLALYWNFLHFYSTWLLYLSICGIIVTIASWKIEVQTNYAQVSYAVIVSIWSCLFVESVIRSTTINVHSWGTQDYEAEEKELSTFVTRSSTPSYGFYEHGGAWVDLSKYASELRRASLLEFVPQNHLYTAGPVPDLGFSESTRVKIWRRFQCLLSSSVLLLLVSTVIAVTLALTVFRIVVQEVNAIYGGLAAGAVNAISIAILDAIYSVVALRLNQWENYRTKTEFEDKLIFKIFCFQFVNAFSSLFYIAFWKSRFPLFGRIDKCLDIDGNETESCIDELSTQLVSLLVVRILIGNFVELGIPYIRPKLSRYLLMWFSNEPEIEEILEGTQSFSLPERQALLPKYSEGIVSGVVYDYLEIAIQFGLVTLFAPAFPLIPLIALVSTNIEGVVDGYKQMVHSRKQFYQGAQDLGSWEAIFRFLSVCAVISNACLLLFTFDTFSENTSAVYYIVFGEHIVLFLQFLLATSINNVPARIRVSLEHAKAIQTIELEHSKYMLERGDRIEHTNAATEEKAIKDFCVNFADSSRILKP